MADRRKTALDSPPVLMAVLFLMVIAFATVGWFGAREQMAGIYGMIRYVQTASLSHFLPYADRFQLDNLSAGMTPEFGSIYRNSVYYGIFTTCLTLLAMFVAILRLSKNDIKGLIRVRSPMGRTYRQVLANYAVTEPSARFFYDYNVLDLPTNLGTARQNYTAMELLFYTAALRGVVRNTVDGSPPYLDVDRDVLKSWFVRQFGPRNPFYGMTNDRLTEVEVIHDCVDRLGWAETLVLYPAILRIYGYHVEDSEGFAATNKMVDAFLKDTWSEMNRFKALYGDGITLGFADGHDRAEREAHYNSAGSKKRKMTASARQAARKLVKAQKKATIDAERAKATAEGKVAKNEATVVRLTARLANSGKSPTEKQRIAIQRDLDAAEATIRQAMEDRDRALEALRSQQHQAYTSTRSISGHETVYLLGRDEREANEGSGRTVAPTAGLASDEMEDFTKDRAKGVKPPAELVMFGEVLSQYAAEKKLKSVVTARTKLKELLTCHLTERTGRYPVSTGKDGRTTYERSIRDKEEQAFNHKAQLRLNDYAKAVEKVLMNHAYQFGVIGGALTEARRSGILPPNQFRWMRFCTETETLWWFVHNLGMPSAVPENAGSFEHFMMERSAGSGITKPYIRQALDGVKGEAERYLTKDMIAEIKSILGNNAVIDEMMRSSRPEHQEKAGKKTTGLAAADLDRIILETENLSPRPVVDDKTGKGKEIEDARNQAVPSGAARGGAPDDLDDFFD